MIELPDLANIGIAAVGGYNRTVDSITWSKSGLCNSDDRITRAMSSQGLGERFPLAKLETKLREKLALLPPLGCFALSR
jgi:hypothetical protein